MSVDNTFEKVDLFLSAKELANIRTFSSTQAYAILYSVHEQTGQLTKIGQTSPKKDDHNPSWSESVRVDYLFEVKQEFLVQIYQLDGSGAVIPEPSVNDLIGEAKFELGPVLRAPSQRLEIPLANSRSGYKNLGSVIARGESVTNSRDQLRVTFWANKLSNKEGFFSKSDPFLVISRLNEDSTYTPVWKNTHIKNTLDPRWVEAIIPITLLCNGDLDRPLKIEIFDHESSGKHVFMGQVITSVQGLLSQGGAGLNVIEPEKQKRSNYVNSGILKASPCVLEHLPTFADYIAGNCDVNLIVGIDFTGSNGDPSMPSSLHYLDPTGQTLNPYQFAIKAVGNILKEYDRDQCIPVYGYGARLRSPDGGSWLPVQHVFPLHPPNTPGCTGGVAGVLAAYQQTIPKVMFSGPTLFAPLLRQVVQHTTQPNTTTQQHYTILLLITDGAIDDMDATLATLSAAAQNPLSVVIVGVGNADFQAMRVLDGDTPSAASKMSRDLVQFVALRDFASRGSQLLAQEVLHEIPTQLLQYMAMHKLAPTPRR